MQWASVVMAVILCSYHPCHLLETVCARHCWLKFHEINYVPALYSVSRTGDLAVSCTVHVASTVSRALPLARGSASIMVSIV